MLRSLKELVHYTVAASDGDIGHVQEFLFDDERWVIRYAVAETGGFWMEGPRVLISPIAFRKAEWDSLKFHVALTRDKVRNSPSVDLDKPVSRQHERDYSRYYDYARYWGDIGIWGLDGHPGSLSGRTWDESLDDPTEKSADVHLRSATAIRAYDIHGTDGTIGHIDDLVIDDQSWEVRYLVIATSDWWFGKKVLVAPQWAHRISWEDSAVYLDLSREQIKNSPVWNPDTAINRELETRVYDYYGRPVYWEINRAPYENPAP